MAQKNLAVATTGQTVELADKETSFYDPVSQLKVVRDRQEKIGKTIGEKTNLAVANGRLLIVESKTKSETSGKSESSLPEDFPGREAFVAAKMDLAAVKAFDFEKDKVEGVGAKTIEAVQAYLKK